MGERALDIWASTFHSACVRILRRDIDRLGFSNNFTIYDTDDSMRVVKEILKALDLDDKMYPPRTVLRYISRAKDDMQLATDFERSCQKSGDYRLNQIAKIYVEYERRLRDADALDFDDIIFHTVRLLLSCDEVRDYWQNKFRYVLIDEYQDTNHLQYMLSSLLAGKWENICVVGDDDQSIYRFRGATIENILSFEERYKGDVYKRQDVDGAGHCKASALLGYLQDASAEHTSLCGCGRKEMVERYNVFWMLTRVQFQLTSPIRWLDRLTIRTGHRQGKGMLLYRDYELLVENREVGYACALWAVSYTHLDVYKRQVLYLH